MDEARASLAEAKRNMTTLSERVQSLESELKQSELQREQLEAELNNAQEVRQRLETSHCMHVERRLIKTLS